MNKLNMGTGALVGGLLTIALMGVLYPGNSLIGLPFVPFDLFDWVIRVLPGPLITFGIDLMIDIMRLAGLSVADTAKTAEQILAILQFLLIGILYGLALFAFIAKRNLKSDLTSGLIIGALFGLPMIAISVAIGSSTSNPVVNIALLAGLFLIWGAAFSWIYKKLSPIEVLLPAATAESIRASAQTINRRQFLIRLGTATATITVIGGGLGTLLTEAQSRRLQQELAASMAHETQGTPKLSFPNANDPVVPAPGTRPEYTPVKDHYKVFLRLEPTVIDGATYVLPITGLVDNPLMLTLDDIRNNYESRNQYVTLACISGRIATDLISTTYWTGVSFQDILADAKVRSNARSLYITSGDGFYETIDLDLIASDERIMLAYAWDGNTIPVDHGFPLRVWIPDRYGMKQPKWITGIEVTDEQKPGYWVERGWDEVAQMRATSVIDTVAVDAIIQNGDQSLVPIGGIAFAGARGISKVEIKVDDGPWQDARLRAPLSDTTWVIWRYDWPFQGGNHEFEVRCVEGDGTRQIEENMPNRPSGATGIHRVTRRL
jgi:DMSO/TMAO reductase YedYZ molybdopterin-dependent catalytic subunit